VFQKNEDLRVEASENAQREDRRNAEVIVPLPCRVGFYHLHILHWFPAVDLRV
jgi:hypothetical protein